jgi:DNA adenine methylase
MPHIEPFLRWAGGKTWLIKHLNTIISDQHFNNYFEPFLGGGVVFFALAPQNDSFLSDLNQELIDTYIAIKQYPQSVIAILEKYENSEVFYYHIRSHHPQTPSEAAARFIYLNQTSFNGLYRVNKKGEYNVPYGYRNKEFLERDKLFQVSRCLQNTTLVSGDFDACRAQIHEGDLVFLDPPYTVSHNNNGFIKYNQNLFSLEDQRRLSRFIDYIKEQGAYYILTNAAHQTINDIFTKENDIRYEFTRASLIGGTNAVRGQISEYIFTNIREGR